MHFKSVLVLQCTLLSLLHVLQQLWQSFHLHHWFSELPRSQQDFYAHYNTGTCFICSASRFVILSWCVWNSLYVVLEIKNYYKKHPTKRNFILYSLKYFCLLRLSHLHHFLRVEKAVTTNQPLSACCANLLCISKYLALRCLCFFLFCLALF